MSNSNEFVIKDGVLEKYIGPGGDVVIPDGVKRIGSSAFNAQESSGCYDISSVVIPSGVTNIDALAFAYCESLINIEIPVGVTAIEECAFECCVSLLNVVLPYGLERIGCEAFSGCKNLMSIEIPDSVRVIEDSAFYECSSLTTVVIPKSIMRVEEFVFSGCKKLRVVIVPFGIDISELGLPKGTVIVKHNNESRFYAYMYSDRIDSNNFQQYSLSEDYAEWEKYDNQMVNNGPIFQFPLPSRLLGGLDRLAHPVDLTEPNRTGYLALLTQKKNINKLISLAEELREPCVIDWMYDTGVIENENTKEISKLIAESSVPEIAASAR